jgi:hypothetical protein
VDSGLWYSYVGIKLLSRLLGKHQENSQATSRLEPDAGICIDATNTAIKGLAGALALFHHWQAWDDVGEKRTESDRP